MDNALVWVGQISTGQEQFGYSPAWLKIKGGGRAGTGRDDCVIEYIEHDGVRDCALVSQHSATGDTSAAPRGNPRAGRSRGGDTFACAG